MEKYISETGSRFTYRALDGAQDCIFIWGHGWGRSHADFLPLAESLQTLGKHYLVDFPGFGQSPHPGETWGTRQYADLFAEWLKTLPAVPKIWIGHSFGCRVGIRLAAEYPNACSKLCLIAAPGLPKKINTWRKMKNFLRVCASEPLKWMLPASSIEKMKNHVGSADYRNAGDMRDIFLATIEEDLTAAALQIDCVTYLIYGELDAETPPELGQRYHQLITNSQLFTLSHLNHYTLLTDGRQQIMTQLKALRNQTV